MPKKTNGSQNALFRRHCFEIKGTLSFQNLWKKYSNQKRAIVKVYEKLPFKAIKFLTLDEFLTSWMIWDSGSKSTIYTNFLPPNFQENSGSRKNLDFQYRRPLSKIKVNGGTCQQTAKVLKIGKSAKKGKWTPKNIV